MTSDPYLTNIIFFDVSKSRFHFWISPQKKVWLKTKTWVPKFRFDFWSSSLNKKIFFINGERHGSLFFIYGNVSKKCSHMGTISLCRSSDLISGFRHGEKHNGERFFCTEVQIWILDFVQRKIVKKQSLKWRSSDLISGIRDRNKHNGERSFLYQSSGLISGVCYENKTMQNKKVYVPKFRWMISWWRS